MKKTDRRAQTTGIPAAEPVHALLTGILEIVPVTRWLFARAEPDGDLGSLAVSLAADHDVAALADELRLQRAASPGGSRIAATLHRFSDVSSGITLIFADARGDYGIMTLLRDDTAGPFTSSEVSVLTFALDAGSEQLAALRHPRARTAATADGPAVPAGIVPALVGEAFYVLDRDLRIVLAWSSERQRRMGLTGGRESVGEHLPKILEESVRDLTAAWTTSSIREVGTARPVSFLVVRTQPMAGPDGTFVGVRIDRFLPPNSLTGAASRFHISPREVQVLALLLDGNQLDQISDELHITSSTIQDHINSMLEKTASRNRSELIARVLGWESRPA